MERSGVWQWNMVTLFGRMACDRMVEDSDFIAEYGLRYYDECFVHSIRRGVVDICFF